MDKIDVQKFRKKPVVIDAIQYDGSNNPFGAIKKHKCDYRMCPLCGGDNIEHDYIETMHDNQSVVVKAGDWIIPDGKPDTFYPCKPDIFEKTYEAANESPEPSPVAEEVGIENHIYALIYAAGKMRDRYSEGDDKVKQQLWKDLHTKADEAREFMESYRNSIKEGNSEKDKLQKYTGEDLKKSFYAGRQKKYPPNVAPSKTNEGFSFFIHGTFEQYLESIK
jgi:hypothetical protein